MRYSGPECPKIDGGGASAQTPVAS